jgi:GNAT superfamily N-acetyltransferase
MQIRLATEQDIESLVDLWMELMEYTIPFGFLFKVENEKRKSAEEILLSHFSKHGSRIYIIESGNRIVAMLIAHIDIRPEIFSYRKIGYIGETIVSKDFRGNHVGSTLVAVVHDWFREEKVDYCELQVAIRNDSSMQFWKSKGYEPQLVRMTHMLK